ncbi:hypothetical protein [Paludisphaera rhizosphaerae]|uniref:hypothetical protein n=1 Tax=Paludisphaera rhizosphaerae TaxID=2711216 RepID=UPI0013EDE34C|nr:hypothetical protein [Paludisphaera rhizosphaerae]
MAAAAARLCRIPSNCGEWRGVDLEYNVRDFINAGVGGVRIRRYTNAQGERVVIMLLCGQPGPLAVHTPDACFVAAGLELRGTPQRRPEASGTEFLIASFSKPATSAVPEALQIRWAWSDGGGWLAPEHPRLSYAGRPVLFKLYIIRDLADTVREDEADPVPRFLRDFLPTLAPIVAPDTSS